MLAPDSRVVSPIGFFHQWEANYDFVDAGNLDSESMHDLQESSSSDYGVETVTRRYLEGNVGSWFSYDLKVVPGEPFAVRIDETGSVYTTSRDYWVQINGENFHHRIRRNHQGWGKSHGGVASYVLDVPASYATSDMVTIKFIQNNNKVASAPSIAAIWTLGNESLPAPGRGGSVSGLDELLEGGTATLIANSSNSSAPYILLDFGKSVAGTLSFDYSAAEAQVLKITYSNSAHFAGIAGDAQTDRTPVPDESQNVILNGIGRWTSDTLRGAFRYVTLMLTRDGQLEVSNVEVSFSAVPNMPVPSAYPGYWYSNDDLLNAVWYAGAYTAQLCTIDPRTAKGGYSAYGNWSNTRAIDDSSSIYVDGGKRDRHVWDGDLAVAFPTAWLSFKDGDSTRNSLRIVYEGQQISGVLRDTSLFYPGSWGDIYHAWGLYSMAIYVLYTGDVTFLDNHWNRHQNGVAYLLEKLSDGLLNTGGGSWFNPADPNSAAGSAAAYLALTSSAALAELKDDTALAADWRDSASVVKQAINDRLWDNTRGVYQQSEGRPNCVSTLGNALAMVSGIADSTRTASILSYLETHMKNPLGYYTVDTDSNTPIPQINSLFVGSWTLRGMMEAGAVHTALDYIRNTWGDQLSSFYGNGSTFLEALTADGESLYDGYESFGHAWSSGPTALLTEFVLGVRPVTAGYQTYQILPHPGNLTHVEGRVPLPGYDFINVSYDIQPGEEFQIIVEIASGELRSGTIGLPKLNDEIFEVRVGESVAWDGSYQPVPGIGGASEDDFYVYLEDVQPGNYAVKVSYETPTKSTPILVGNGSGSPTSLHNPVELSLDNSDDKIKGVQVDICDGDNYLTPSVNACEITDRTPGFVCLFNELQNGCVRVILLSVIDELIDEGKGPIFTLKYDVSGEAPPQECINLNLQNVKVSDEFGNALEMCAFPGNFCFVSCGDIAPKETCGDGKVDLYDALKMIDIVLGITVPSDCQLAGANVPNGIPPECRERDDDIDIFDIMVIIDIILKRDNCCES